MKFTQCHELLDETNFLETGRVKSTRPPPQAWPFEARHHARASTCA